MGYHCETHSEPATLHMKSINFMAKLTIYNFSFKYHSPSGRNLNPLTMDLRVNRHCFT